MSLDSLPYMVFLVLVEFTVGGAIVTAGTQLRGLVTKSYVKLCAACVAASGALAVWVSLGLGRPADVGGYPLDERYLTPATAVLWALLALLVIYTVLLARERERESRIAGVLAGVVGAVAIGLTAAVLRLPAWGYVGVLLSLLTGALSLGAVTMGMMLGHWYLVTPRLPEQPLNELTFVLIVVLAVQSLLVLVNLVIPVRLTPVTGSVGLAQNPAFWLRLGVGLLFPVVLAVLAWRASIIRGMMSATGLLYLATGAVLAGEALARGLQFTTAIPF